jgi:hypothetical protein
MLSSERTIVVTQFGLATFWVWFSEMSIWAQAFQPRPTQVSIGDHREVRKAIPPLSAMSNFGVISTSDFYKEADY